MCDEGVFVLAETGDVYSGQWSNDRMNGALERRGEVYKTYRTFETAL